MSIEEENKALVRYYYQLINQKKIDATYEHYAPECIFHMPSGDLSVREGREFDDMAFAAFPDLMYTIVGIIAEGDTVACRVNVKGTNLGEMMSHPATGKKVEFNSSHWFRMADNIIVEFWGFSDRLSLMQQLGIVTESI